MTLDHSDLINSILESLDRIDYIKSADIPNIDLYMDQVTTMMDSRLRSTTRNPEDDKVLTKTMINNYAKNDLLPPPVKKKYSKEHVLVLIFIYYFKGVMSINDIQVLLKPLTDKYFSKDGNYDLTAIYDEVFQMEKEEVEWLKENVRTKYERSQKTFLDKDTEEEEFLRKFSFICLLAFDVYVKKLIIEKMLDDIAGTDNSVDSKAKKTAEKKEKAEKKQKKETVEK